MSDEIAIKVAGVGKTFKLPHEKNSSVKGAVLNFYKRNRTYETQQVLKDISFEIKKGEFFGIVGRNGSGKSTLLKLLAGIYTPSKGRIQVNGKLTPFIELGVGFNPELTGRENVFLNGALLGFNRSEMNKMYDDIVEFAELEKFMDQKLKNYSSGMQVRLAFSIAIRANSDILLIDEVLAVGDAAFQTKCFDYFHELKHTGATVIFVSHDKTSLERFCNKGILIDNGKLVYAGNIQEVLKEYSGVVLDELSSEYSQHKHGKTKIKRGKLVEIKNVAIKDERGNTKNKVKFGESLTVYFEVSCKKSITNPILGVTIWQKNVSKAVYATNSLIEGINTTGAYSEGQTITFQAILPDLLNDGEYYVEPAVANESGTVFFDQEPKAFTFHINGSKNPHSVISTQKSIEIGCIDD